MKRSDVTIDPLNFLQLDHTYWIVLDILRQKINRQINKGDTLEEALIPLARAIEVLETAEGEGAVEKAKAELETVLIAYLASLNYLDLYMLVESYVRAVTDYSYMGGDVIAAARQLDANESGAELVTRHKKALEEFQTALKLEYRPYADNGYYAESILRCQSVGATCRFATFLEYDLLDTSGHPPAAIEWARACTWEFMQSTSFLRFVMSLGDNFHLKYGANAVSDNPAGAWAVVAYALVTPVNALSQIFLKRLQEALEYISEDIAKLPIGCMMDYLLAVANAEQPLVFDLPMIDLISPKGLGEGELRLNPWEGVSGYVRDRKGITAYNRTVLSECVSFLEFLLSHHGSGEFDRSIRSIDGTSLLKYALANKVDLADLISPLLELAAASKDYKKVLAILDDDFILSLAVSSSPSRGKQRYNSGGSEVEQIELNLLQGLLSFGEAVKHKWSHEDVFRAYQNALESGNMDVIRVLNEKFGVSYFSPVTLSGPVKMVLQDGEWTNDSAKKAILGCAETGQHKLMLALLEKFDDFLRTEWLQEAFQISLRNENPNVAFALLEYTKDGSHTLSFCGDGFSALDLAFKVNVFCFPCNRRLGGRPDQNAVMILKAVMEYCNAKGLAFDDVTSFGSDKSVGTATAILRRAVSEHMDGLIGLILKHANDGRFVLDFRRYDFGFGDSSGLIEHAVRNYILLGVHGELDYVKLLSPPLIGDSIYFTPSMEVDFMEGYEKACESIIQLIDCATANEFLGIEPNNVLRMRFSTYSSRAEVVSNFSVRFIQALFEYADALSLGIDPDTLYALIMKDDMCEAVREVLRDRLKQAFTLHYEFTQATGCWFFGRTVDSMTGEMIAIPERYRGAFPEAAVIDESSESSAASGGAGGAPSLPPAQGGSGPGACVIC